MRSLPTLLETRFSLSFFLTTPAKKPRTECCCQQVAFMIVAMVVPFGWRSIASTSPCFEEDGAAALTAPIFGFGFGCVWPLALAVPFAPLGDLRAVPVALDFDLLAAIGSPLGERQHRVLPLTRAP